MVVFGMYLEAIKMCLLVRELKTREKLQTIICMTGQHKEMLDQVLIPFDVVLGYDLLIMKSKQALFDVAINILEKLKRVIEEVKSDLVLV